MDGTFYRIILFGREIEKLKEFYTVNFGCIVLEEIKNEWVVMKSGGMEIALHKIGRAYNSNSNDPFKANSNTKMIFIMQADIHAMRQQLIAAGAEMREITTFSNSKSLFCDGTDFEGNTFQLEQKSSIN